MEMPLIDATLDFSPWLLSHTDLLSKLEDQKKEFEALFDGDAREHLVSTSMLYNDAIRNQKMTTWSKYCDMKRRTTPQ